jgi:hypothetical protein
MVSPIFQLKDLTPRQLSALRRKARKLGVTPDVYVKELIEDDLAMDRKARVSTFDELAAPLRQNLKKLGNDDIDRLVEKARGKRRNNKRR